MTLLYGYIEMRLPACDFSRTQECPPLEVKEEDIQRLTSRESYRQAKIEHYLERVEEYVQMARYDIARKTIESVFRLDPENSAGIVLLKAIEESLNAIQHRHNGAPPSGNGNGSPKRKRTELVLVVDQDERLLVSLIASLRHYGFQVLGAASYDEALEILAIVRPEVVVSEVNFESGPRGFDLYTWLKNNLSDHEIPFLFLAARIDRDVLIAGKRFGVDDFILKPIDNEVVTASIANCLARRRSVPARLDAVAVQLKVP
jgi:CheY-like chemotaxis protein